MDEQPDFSTWSDRKWSIHASNRAGEAVSIVGDLQSRWNTMVEDNRFLLSQIDALTARLTDLEETVDMLTTIILDQSQETLPNSALQHCTGYFGTVSDT